MTADEPGTPDSMPGETPIVAALRLAALGWSVVPVHTVARGRCSCRRSPCPSPGKHPRVPWERWMTRTARPTEVEAWWDRWSRANVGVVTGWVSAIVVLDVDPRHGGDETLAALEAEEEPLPATVTAISGGGGRHFYFAHPTHLVPSRPLAPGVDLKAEGGLVVVPPSRHASGGTYRWLADHGPDQRRPAPLPHWLDRRSVAVDAAWAAAQAGTTIGAGTTAGAAAGAGATITRTADEQAVFAALWSELGVNLQPAEFMALCPFHDDHQPSLHIDPGGCRWFCFGCRRGGGIQALHHLVEPDDESLPPTLAAAATGEHAPTLTPDVEVGIVGESAHQDALLALTGGRRTWSGAHRRVVARLEPEDDNPFDSLAVAVTIDGRPVGHLPRHLARRYRPVIEEAIRCSGAAACRAEIRGGWERAHGDVGRFGVVVHLPEMPDHQ